jgi:hypothetical protein
MSRYHSHLKSLSSSGLLLLGLIDGAAARLAETVQSSRVAFYFV